MHHTSQCTQHAIHTRNTTTHTVPCTHHTRFLTSHTPYNTTHHTQHTPNTQHTHTAQRRGTHTTIHSYDKHTTFITNTLCRYTHTPHITHPPTMHISHIPILPHTLHRPTTYSQTPHISHICVLPRPHTCHIKHSHYATNGYSSYMSLFCWLSASKPDLFLKLFIY